MFLFFRIMEPPIDSSRISDHDPKITALFSRSTEPDFPYRITSSWPEGRFPSLAQSMRSQSGYPDEVAIPTAGYLHRLPSGCREIISAAFQLKQFHAGQEHAWRRANPA